MDLKLCHRDSPQNISILQFNILAHSFLYADRYPYCKDECLNAEHRKKDLLFQIEHSNAGIFDTKYHLS